MHYRKVCPPESRLAKSISEKCLENMMNIFEDVFGVGVWITGFDIERLAEWLQVHLY